MSIIDTIRTNLKRYPDLNYTFSNTLLSIEPESPEGFPVAIDAGNGKFVVYFRGWHERFFNEVEALNCFAMGLSKQSRLRIFSRGGYEYRWILERLTDGKWVEISQTGLLFFPFWRKATVRIHQNAILDF